MPTVRHPRAREDVAGHPPARVTVRGETFAVARDESPATVTLPGEAHVRALAAAYDLDASAILVSDSPAEMVERGVCPWCDDYEGDGVPQHASSAHPEEWAAFKEDT